MTAIARNGKAMLRTSGARTIDAAASVFGRRSGDAGTRGWPSVIGHSHRGAQPAVPRTPSEQVLGAGALVVSSQQQQPASACGFESIEQHEVGWLAACAIGAIWPQQSRTSDSNTRLKMTPRRIMSLFYIDRRRPVHPIQPRAGVWSNNRPVRAKSSFRPWAPSGE